MSATTMEQLEIQINSSSTNAVEGISKLSRSLNRLNTVLKNSFDTSNVVQGIQTLNAGLKQLDGSAADKLRNIAESLKALKSVGTVTVSVTNGDSDVNKIRVKVESLRQSMGNLTETLNTTSTAASKTNSSLNALSTGVSAAKTNQSSLSASSIQSATGMNKMSANALSLRAVLSSLKNATQRVADSNDNMSKSSVKATLSYTDLLSKAAIWIGTAKTIFGTIKSFVDKSNQYVEDLNLFTASLGEYAGEAQKFAERASEILGIDPSEFMRNEGVFNSIIEGFGVANDQAYLMSKNLTQLGYDLSSFYNTDVETAMQKLQSGVSGELEPLRRWGYDLSVARLQQEALNLGISKSVSNMTQAEKSQLRYYAIMTQVTQVQGDMARTLNAPANQLRVFKAQCIMAARAIGDVFIPIINKVLPYLIAFAKIVRMVFAGIAKVFGFSLPKVDYSGINTGAKAMGNLGDKTNGANNALGKTPKKVNKVTKALKKLKNATIGIDELNIISPDTNSSPSGSGGSGGIGGGGGGGIGGIGGGDLGFKLPEYDFLKGAVASKADEIVKKIKSTVKKIALILGGALLAVGAILFFFGGLKEKGLGLGLMAAGAVMFGTGVAASLNGKVSKDIMKILTEITAILGGALLALGAVLFFTGGSKALGIGLMVAGATSLVASIGLSTGAITNDIKRMVTQITLIVAAATLAIGAILLYFGQIKLAVPLLLIGVASLVTAVGINKNAIVKFISSGIKAVWKFIQNFSACFIVLGVTMIMSEAMMPIGIALLALGATALVSGIVTDGGGNIKSSVKSFMTATKKIIMNVGKLALGVLLLMVPGLQSRGLGLIADGLDGLKGKGDSGFSKVLGKVSGFFKGIKKLWDDFYKWCGEAWKNFKKSKFFGWLFADDDKSTKKTKGGGFDNKFLSGYTKDSLKVGETVGKNVKKGTEKGWGDSAKGFFEKYLKPMKETSKRTKVDAPKPQLEDNTAELWKQFKGWWEKKTGTPLSVKGMVELTQKGWKSVQDWVSKYIGEPVSESVKLAKEKWKTVKDWVGNHIGGAFSEKVNLAKEKWEDVKSWVSKFLGGDFFENVGLSKTWDTVLKWVKEHTGGIFYKGVHLLKSFGKGIQTVKDWLTQKPQSGGEVKKQIGVTKTKSWSSGIAAWIKGKGNWGGSVKKEIGVSKSKDWNIGGIAKWIIRNYMGGKVAKPIDLKKNGWSKVSSWVSKFKGNPVNAAVKLAKKDWKTVGEWVGSKGNTGDPVKKSINLAKGNWAGKTVEEWVKKHSTGNGITVTVNLKKKGGKAAGGGIFTKRDFTLLAGGGVITDSIWKATPKYAGGTNNAHGSMFIAGEAGAELVGHINGRTEVMNRFQLASVMEHAIVVGMSRFTQFWSELSKNVVLCANGVINAVLVSSDAINGNMAMATATSYEGINRLARYAVSEDSRNINNDRISDEEWKRNMRDFYVEYVEPTLKGIANDTKRQADKKETTVVQIGNKTVAKSIREQEKANGYRFTK